MPKIKIVKKYSSDINLVVKAQSLQVDAISGATYNSKIILLAIEDALKSTME